MLEELFREIILLYSASTGKSDQYWLEILNHYSGPDRHYHTLEHLDNMIEQLLPVKKDIKDWESIVLATAYHDIIYKTLKQDNEERSAAIAADRIDHLSIEKDRVTNVAAMILATKKHESHGDNDTAYFIDADLSILGTDPSSYLFYTEQIRKEYKYYPDFLYNPARKKVLNNFLIKDKIFQTTHFYSKYELQARSNIRNEMQLL